MLRTDRFGEPWSWRVVTDSYSMTAINREGLRYMQFFGWLPLALHPEPRRALLISYGAGNTARALLDDPALERLTVVDVSPEILAASRLMRFPTSVKRDPAIDAWFESHHGELAAIARHWFTVLRRCGDDVRELLHDGHPTACLGDAAFAYVNAFRDHVNVGFFRGAEILDPDGLLQGTGRFMRHVKLGPAHSVDPRALESLIQAAYADIRRRIGVV